MLFDKDPDEHESGRESLIRIGEVTAVDPSRLTARVTFDDDDGVTSFDLPILQRNTLRNHDFATVDIGEDVVCVFLPSGVEEGFIVGSLYAGEIVPPSSSPDVRMIAFEDGTSLSYNRKTHRLEGDIKGDAVITLTGSAEVTAEGTVAVTAEGAVSVSSSEKIVLTAPEIVLNGAITSYSQTGGAGTMQVNGTMEITGDITGESDITASGISLVSHTHTGDSGGTTSAPN